MATTKKTNKAEKPSQRDNIKEKLVSITPKDKLTTTTPAVSYDEDYLCTLSFKRVPVSINFAERLVVELLKFVNSNEDVIALQPFLQKMNMYQADFTRLRKRYSIVEEAYSIVRDIFAHRREMGAIKGGWNASWLRWTQYQFSDSFREADLYQANLKKLGTPDQEVNITINKEPMPSTNLVKERSKKIDV
jgi:hypothetical protein